MPLACFEGQNPSIVSEWEVRWGTLRTSQNIPISPLLCTEPHCLAEGIHHIIHATQVVCTYTQRTPVILEVVGEREQSELCVAN